LEYHIKVNTQINNELQTLKLNVTTLPISNLIEKWY